MAGSIGLRGRHVGIICPACAPELRYDTAMAIDEAEIRRSLEATAATQPVKPPKPHWALTAIGIATALALCYWAELVLAVMLVSVLLAFILAPVMDFLIRLRLPRGLAAAAAVLLMLSVGAGLVYYSSNQALVFVQDLSKYAQRIQREISQVRQQAENLGTLDPAQKSADSHANWTDLLTRGFGSVSQAVLSASFIPFLVYFMLSWQQHVRSATVMLFSLPHRQTAYVTLGLISAMIRTFMVGNLLIGLFLGMASSIAFALLHLPFFYFIGFISGFLSLVPYLGILLAIAPPFFVSVGLISSGDAVVIVVIVVGLHLIALNVLYPMFLGNRLQLNPLAVTMALLVWGWLWGAMGLVLAIPITAAMKIVFDHVESLKPYGAWMGE
jgi:predicted PurR-regulated permease PerM